MKKVNLMLVAALFAAGACFAEDIDLFILAGQSNAQGVKGSGANYPADPGKLDKSIRFYWVTPGISSSDGEWTTMKAQGGMYKDGHFGLEVTFARSLKQAGCNPAIFKYSRGSTSLAGSWKGPGDGGMYDQMVEELKKAVSILEKKNHKVNIRGFVWIQGESDAKTSKVADLYKGKLKTLIDDLRKNATKNLELAVILGVDEQHKFVRKNPQVVRAQQELAGEDEHAVFTTMMGLPKADGTHLKPEGLEEHGKRIYSAYKTVIEGR